MKSIIITTIIVCLVLLRQPLAHCEIPCGIYNDSMRVSLIAEHIGTIEKSMKTIISLSKKQPANYNQIVRWVDNKESHAEKIQEIVFQYFMTQRVKPASPDKKEAYAKYIKELSLLHKLLVFTMKCKQTTDAENIKQLRKVLHEFSQSYFSKK